MASSNININDKQFTG